MSSMSCLFQNGVLSSLPYLAMWVVEIIGSQILDLLRRKKLISTTVARKVFNTTGKFLIISLLHNYMYCLYVVIGMGVDKHGRVAQI